MNTPENFIKIVNYFKLKIKSFEWYKTNKQLKFECDYALAIIQYNDPTKFYLSRYHPTCEKHIKYHSDEYLIYQENNTRDRLRLAVSWKQGYLLFHSRFCLTLFDTFVIRMMIDHIEQNNNKQINFTIKSKNIEYYCTFLFNDYKIWLHMDVKNENYSYRLIITKSSNGSINYDIYKINIYGTISPLTYPEFSDLIYE